MNKIWEQSDGSLILPNWDIISFSERNKIINSSLDTPIRQKELEIKDIIANNNSAILIGETWSWKTTEFPQIIHELYPNDIIITNIPLVAATIWTATYVSKILYCKTANPYYILGNGWVWYRTWKWVSEKNRTQIGFHTYWLDYLNVSLGNFERFLNSSDKNVHIILDEIHEKSEDFLFYLPRILELRKKFPDRVKVYWASATISDNYLDKLLDNKKWLWQNTPVIRVDWRTFPIDDIIEYWAKQIDKAVELYNQWKSILIFEPWKSEIKKVINELHKRLWDNVIIQEIHSQVSKEQLNLVLTLEWVQKIFVATNAARTGITLDINSVVDSGLQKMQYYNEYWIPILLKEGISYDAYMQNRGRAWRKEKWIAIYTWEEKIEDMPEESLSSIEIKVDEKKILTEILNWVKVEELYDRLLFEPNKKMLYLSIKRMKQVGLLTEDNKITTVWFEVLKFPISVFNWRILVEAMELWIVDKLIPYVSILEERWFINKNFDIKKFKQSFFNKDFSDLEIQEKLFSLFFEKNLENHILWYLYWLWIESSKIDAFRYSNDLLIDILDDDDFWKLGLNKKNILSIKNRIDKIKLTLSKYNPKINENLWLDNKQLRELISKSILAGNLFNLYEARNTELFEAFYDDTWNKIIFEKSETSYVKIIPGSIYVWEPYIIGWEKEDKSIFSLITRINEWDIYYFETKKYKEYQRTKKEKISDFSVDDYGDTFVVPKYLQDIDKKKKYIAINWLPYFLLVKNNFFAKYRDDYKDKFWFFDEDRFIKLLWRITIKFYNKLSLDKEENIKKFIWDDEILKAFLSSNDKEIVDFREWKKAEKKIFKLEILKEENLYLKYIKKVREYNKILEEAQSYVNRSKVNIEKISNEILDNLITFFEENSSDYSQIIIFLKNKKNKNIKNLFITYEKLNKKFKKLLKDISWLNDFISLLDKIKSRELSTLKWLDFFNLKKEELLLKDPIIKKLDINTDILILKKDYKKIQKLFSKLNLNISEEYLFENLMKILSSSKKNYQKGSLELEKIKASIFSKITELRKEKNLLLKESTSNLQEKNKKIKEINKNIWDLYLFYKLFKEYISNLKNLRNKIETVEFKDLLLFSSLKFKKTVLVKSKKKKSKKVYHSSNIYNKKFLYETVVSSIFLWEDFNLTQKEFEIKLRKKLSKILWDRMNEEKIDLFVEVLKVYVNTNVKNNSWQKLNWYITFFKNLLKEYEEEKIQLLNEIQSEQFKNVNNIIIWLKGLLNLIFDEDKVELNSNKIYSFAKKFSSYTVNNFDEKLKELLLNFWLFHKNTFIWNRW